MQAEKEMRKREPLLSLFYFGGIRAGKLVTSLFIVSVKKGALSSLACSLSPRPSLFLPPSSSSCSSSSSSSRSSFCSFTGEAPETSLLLRSSLPRGEPLEKPPTPSPPRLRADGGAQPPGEPPPRRGAPAEEPLEDPGVYDIDDAIRIRGAGGGSGGGGRGRGGRGGARGRGQRGKRKGL